MLSIIGAIFAIGLLIVVHEGGHYFVAKLCKMRVDRFSIGFGPALLKWRRKETDFVLAPIPFGGYVQIAGMNIAEEVDNQDPTAYPNRPARQRFLTIFAGPATNYLFAIVLAFGLYSFAGVPTGTVWYEVIGTRAGYDAVDKLHPGDRIVSVDGSAVFMAHGGRGGPSLTDKVQASKGSPLQVTVLRNGEQITVAVSPKLGEIEGREGELYLLGVDLNPFGHSERTDIGVFGSVKEALYYPVRQTEIIVSGLYEVVRGRAEGELTGPVGITTAIKRQFRFGWIRVIEVLMLLNVYLGLFNLLPLPALDGGRLVFLGYEMVTRRRANPKVEATVHMVGILFLLVVMVAVTYKDITRLF